MFRIRVFTPPLITQSGWPHAGAELLVGDARLLFRVDLRYWRIADYERQWKAGIARLAGGASSSALMSAFRGPTDAPHHMWALWREGGWVYVQPHCVLRAELSVPFDPVAPYPLVAERIPVTESDLPLLEWRVEVAQLFATVFGIRWPFAQ
jgi:CdiI N-terminal domain